MPAKPHKSTPTRAVTKDTGKAVLVYFPVPDVASMDAAVIREDTDRSKWIRKAVREALARRGIIA